MVFYANEHSYQILFLSDTNTVPARICKFFFANMQTHPSRAHRQLSSEYLGLLLNGPGSVVCN